MYKRISDYGIIGNSHSVALVGIDGSIDWLCLPHIDSPSVFAALLDDRKGGCFSISPAEEYDSTAEYLEGTNILRTRFRTRAGNAAVTDFMPVPPAGAEHGEEMAYDLYRIIDILNGDVEMEVVFKPRFNYARVMPVIEKMDSGVIARSEKEILCLACSKELEVSEHEAKARWTLSKGERVVLLLRYGVENFPPSDAAGAGRALKDTEDYWRQWLRRSETGRTVDLGPYKDMVERSALALKLLSYETMGTIAAAATTSLPEEIGGSRNWDYRYSWVRDTSFTLQALFNLGHLSEMEGYLRWIENLLSGHGAGKMQIMYGLRGEEELPEEELTHLDGYKNSRPVRIGNAAAMQRQLDIYGELMDAALKLSDYVGKIDTSLWPFLKDICDYVVAHWQEPDSGIWEVRGDPFHFVYSKVMCWLALDRGITISRRYGFPADVSLWEETCEKIRDEVLEKGWSERKSSFVQHYGTDSLDASNILIPILGFLPFDDPRVISTLDATERELGRDGFLSRYSSEDGLPGKEGSFLLCTFWHIDALIGLGKIEEAEALLRRAEGAANHLGLFSEEYDTSWREALGNFPQAFTHIGYINSVISLRQARRKTKGEDQDRRVSRLDLLLAREIVLNEGSPDRDILPREIGMRLKEQMNILRGAFFDTGKGRVAYERMKESEAYAEYVKRSLSLQKMDLGVLQGSDERMAFWINLYNVIVIHGVIELGIRDSVQEVRNFFRRIRYRIGHLFFSPDDIEHGILRSNHRLPVSLFRPFRSGDERLAQVIHPMDPRIHFALVCASSSCPPIAVYTAQALDQELDISARTFLNSGGLLLDKTQRTVSLSRIFKWYGKDFGEDEAAILKFLLPYLYDAEDARFISEHGRVLSVHYQEYDWRLNRY